MVIAILRRRNLYMDAQTTRLRPHGTAGAEARNGAACGSRFSCYQTRTEGVTDADRCSGCIGVHWFQNCGLMRTYYYTCVLYPHSRIAVPPICHWFCVRIRAIQIAISPRNFQNGKVVPYDTDIPPLGLSRVQ